MYRTERQPAWQRDITWVSGVLLALAVMAGTLLFTQVQLASPERGVDVIRGILQLTLQPGGSASAELGVRAGSSYQAGQPLTLLPGVGVFADPTEVPTFTVDAAIGRIAGVLTGQLIAGGSQSMLTTVSDPVLREQLEAAVNGPIDSLVRGSLESEMLPAGLDDGTRLADWEAQAAGDPGEPVQPVVGVFVYESPTAVARMTAREIGVNVIGQLSDTVMAEGLDAALALVTNSNLRARLNAGVNSRARAEIHGLLVALLLGRSTEIAGRLDEAARVLAGDETESDALSGLLPASQLAGLSPEEADAAVLDALAERAYDGGSTLAAAQLTNPEQGERVRGVAPLIDAFTAQARTRYTTWLILTGVLAVLLLGLVIGFSRGLMRLSNAGIAIVLGAAAGAFLFDRARRLLPEDAALPAGPLVQGVFSALSGTLAYIVTALPGDVVALALRNHLVLLLIGASLILLALVLWLLRGVRPRRRSFL
ncbi:MAG TPA: hypothetical protein VFD39_06430 [Trueperaceae bacterium]|nr:hypothetical protein [Trueperaceae bacterium]